MHFPVITEEERLLPLYVTGIGHQNPQEKIHRPDGFNDYQWIYCARGEGKITVNHQEFIVTAGQGFYLAPNIAHEYTSIKGPWETYWIMYNGTAIDLIYHQLNLGIFGTINIGSNFSFYTSIYTLLTSDITHKIIDSSVILYQLIVQQKDSLQSTLTSKTVSPVDKLQPVIQYMRSHLHEDLSLDQLADTIDVTTYYLCKLFKSAFGLAPIKYLTQLRIQHAKELLLTKASYPVWQIAQSVGYRDTSYFCHVFKQNELLSPTAFRKNHGL
ncbi:AraC family transcriptional regulator [Vallitaleaceae bacterium 9-2]